MVHATVVTVVSADLLFDVSNMPNEPVVVSGNDLNPVIITIKVSVGK